MRIMGLVTNNTGRTIIVEINTVGMILNDQQQMPIDGNDNLVISHYGPTEEERKRWDIRTERGNKIREIMKRLTDRE